MHLSRPSQRWQGAAPFVWLLVILAVVYAPMFFGQVIFFRDPAHWNYPARWFLRDAILRGDSPLWNPRVGLGLPVLASPLYGLFYPPNWLYALAPKDWVVRLLTWQSFAHMYGGGAGVIVLGRRFGLRNPAALIAGLAWSLSGYITSMWSAGILVLADAWLPWIGVAFVSLGRATVLRLRGWSATFAMAAAAVGFAMLLGEVFVAAMGVGFGILTALVDAFARRGSGVPFGVRQAGWLIGSLALAATLGASLAAVTILPARALSKGTERAQPLPRADAEMYSVHPLRLVEFVSQGSMGNPYENYVASRWVGEPRVDNLPLGFSLYCGAGFVMLSLLAFRRADWLSWGFAALVLMALLVSMGRHTPLHQLLRTAVPPLSYMRYPEKYFICVATWFALLAGLGAQRLIDGQASVRRLLLGAGLVILPLVALRLFPAAMRPWVLKGSLQAAGVAAVILGVAFLMRRRPRWAVTGLVLMGAADTASAALVLQEFAPAKLATDEQPVLTRILDDFGPHPYPPRLYRQHAVDNKVSLHVGAFNNAESELRALMTLIVNTGTTFGVAQMPAYDAAAPTAYRRFWESDKATRTIAFRTLGVDYAILGLDSPVDPPGRGASLEAMMDPLPGARLYRVKASLPRVYLAGRAEVLSGDEVGKKINDPEGPFAKVTRDAAGIVFLTADGLARSIDVPSGRAGACTITSFHNTTVSATCDGDREGVAVFLEQYEDGWTAQVDGHDVPVNRANLMFRGIPVTAGRHLLTLRYRPPGWRQAAAISACATLAVLILGFLGVVARRHTSQPARGSLARSAS